MKNHAKKTVSEWNGQHSADPLDRINPSYLKLLQNGYCDATGRIVRSGGVNVIATAESWGIVPEDGPVTPWSYHEYNGSVGEIPGSRALVVVGSRLIRSLENDLFSPWDEITFSTDMPQPELNRPAAGVFRNKFFFHQNGFDPPFRVECEVDDPSAAVSNEAVYLGLRQPAFGVDYSGRTPGDMRRFPPNVWTSYAVTFVYGTRGESGPSPVFSVMFTTIEGTQDKISLQNIPKGPEGCTARRIYRSDIGRGLAPAAGSIAGEYVVKQLESGAFSTLFFHSEIPNNTTTAIDDEKDNAGLDHLRRCPQPRPFPPIAAYQIMHLDKIFWAKLREHPWVCGVMYDKTRSTVLTDYRVTISNSGNGTITFEKNNAGWSNDLVISSYKTKTLREIMVLMLTTNVTTSLNVLGYTDGQGVGSGGGVCVTPQAGLDLDRTYTFVEVTQQSIYDPEDVYWFVNLDDDATEGTRWTPNRWAWSDVTFPEQVSYRNSDDLTRFGSKQITGLTLLDNQLEITTTTDTWNVTGSFVPDSTFGIPSFEVHRSQASHGTICTRPDAIVSIPMKGLFMVADDALRLFRGDDSNPAAIVIRDQFLRVLTEPVARRFLSQWYWKGEAFVILPTYEVE